MIYTSSYRGINLKDFKDKTISISGDRGRLVNYNGPYYSSLAPKKDFWEVWHSNIGRIPVKENTKYYIREYYKEVLSKLDVNKVAAELDEKILLCYEYSTDFCHRQIVASWFELFLNTKVSEVEQNGYYLENRFNPKKQFIKDYLEEVIKENTNMMGFDNLYSLNLYKKSEELENKARNNNDIEFAMYLRDLAFESNEEFNNKLKKTKDF